jgi:hypothetical protein
MRLVRRVRLDADDHAACVADELLRDRLPSAARDIIVDCASARQATGDSECAPVGARGVPPLLRARRAPLRGQGPGPTAPTASLRRSGKTAELVCSACVAGITPKVVRGVRAWQVCIAPAELLWCLPFAQLHCVCFFLSCDCVRTFCGASRVLAG